MAGTKETPRQRMIGMMYLVLTALLAMNVSKDILHSFVVINKGLETTNENFQQKNQSIMDEFRAQMAFDPIKTRPHYQNAQTVESLSAELNDYIESLKKHLIGQTGGYDESAPDSLYQLGNVDSKDNYDIPTEILIGSEPAFPKEGEFSALELKSKINTYRESLVQVFDPGSDADVIHKISEDLKLNEVPDPEGKMESWEVGNFYHLPLAACITNLSKIQSDIRNAEADALSELYENITGEDYNFDTIAARVIPRSSYVLLGEEYEADVFLAAFSRTEQPEVLLGAFEEESGAFSASDSLEVEEGLGHMAVKTTREGFQKYEGMIKIKKRDGSTKEFPFASEYLVAKPSLTVAPTAMNVFYKGIANPVEISVPGVANENLSVRMTGGNSIRQKGDGLFEVNMVPNSPRDVEVVVTATLTDGSQREMGRRKFRAKQLPTPFASIGGVSTSGRMTNNELISKQGIRAQYGDDFQFNIIPVVTKFKVSTRYRGSQIGPRVTGNRWTQEVINIIEALPAGTQVIFEHIEAEGPDGIPRPLSPIVITIR